MTTSKGDEQRRAAHISRGTTHPETINNEEKETHCSKDERDFLKSSTDNKTSTVHGDNRAGNGESTAVQTALSNH